jgi:long-chain acyl-CoA synthetase
MKPKPLYNVRHIRDFRDLLEQSSGLFGDKAAFMVREKGGFKSITYSRMKSDVDALGAGLRSLGLENGHIAVLGENRYEWCISYLAVTCHTGVVVPIDKELPADEKRNLLERSDSSALVFSGKYAKDIESIRNAGSSVKYFIGMDMDEDGDGFLSLGKLIEKGRELIKSNEFDPHSRKIDETAMSVLIFTSGTTDMAKGVMLSQKNICTDVMGVSQTVRVESKDTALSILPLHHTYECTIGFLTLIYNGACIAFNEGLKHIQKNMAEVGPTLLVTVPLLLENMYKKIWDRINKKPGLKHIVRIMLGISTVLRFFGIEAGRVLFASIHKTLGRRS